MSVQISPNLYRVKSNGTMFIIETEDLNNVLTTLDENIYEEYEYDPSDPITSSLEAFNKMANTVRKLEDGFSYAGRITQSLVLLCAEQQSEIDSLKMRVLALETQMSTLEYQMREVQKEILLIDKK